MVSCSFAKIVCLLVSSTDTNTVERFVIFLCDFRLIIIQTSVFINSPRECSHSGKNCSINPLRFNAMRKLIHKRFCRVNFANLQKIDFLHFLTLRIGRNIECQYALKVAALIIANFDFRDFHDSIMCIGYMYV